MKIMNILRLLLIPALLLAMQVDAVGETKRKPRVRRAAVQAKKEVVAQAEPTPVAEDMVSDVRKDLESATNEAAKKITECTIAKNHARRSLAMKLISEDDADERIKEQDQKIVQIKEDLKKVLEEALAVVDETEKQTSSVQQFISGAQRLGTQGLSKISSYFGYSQDDKNLASAIIAELERLKISETDPVIREEIEKEIYAQKLITGQEWNTQKYLLLGAATTAALVAGVSLGSALLKSPSAQDLTGAVTSPAVSAVSAVDWIPSYPGEEPPFVRRTPGAALEAAQQLLRPVGAGFTQLTPEEPTIVPSTPGSAAVGEAIQRATGKAGEKIGQAVARSVTGTEYESGLPEELRTWTPSSKESEKGGQVFGAKLKELGRTFVTGVGQGPTPEELNIVPLTPGAEGVTQAIRGATGAAAEKAVGVVKAGIKGLGATLKSGVKVASKEFEELKDISGATEPVASKDIGTELGQFAKAAGTGIRSVGSLYKAGLEGHYPTLQTPVVAEPVEGAQVDQTVEGTKGESVVPRFMRSARGVIGAAGEELGEAAESGARKAYESLEAFNERMARVGKDISDFAEKMPERVRGGRPETSLEPEAAHKVGTAAMEKIGEGVEYAGQKIQKEAGRIAQERAERLAANEEEKRIMEENRLKDEQRAEQRRVEQENRRAEMAKQRELERMNQEVGLLEAKVDARYDDVVKNAAYQNYLKVDNDWQKCLNRAEAAGMPDECDALRAAAETARAAWEEEDAYNGYNDAEKEWRNALERRRVMEMQQ